MNISNIALPYINLIAAFCFIALHIGVRSHAAFYISLKLEHLLKNLRMLKTQINLMLISAGILCIVSFFLAFASEDPIYATLASTLCSLYVFALFNLLYISYLFIKIHKNLNNPEHVSSANENLALILYYFVPLNIIISLVAVFLTLILESLI